MLTRLSIERATPCPSARPVASPALQPLGIMLAMGYPAEQLSHNVQLTNLMRRDAMPEPAHEIRGLAERGLRFTKAHTPPAAPDATANSGVRRSPAAINTSLPT